MAEAIKDVSLIANDDNFPLFPLGAFKMDVFFVCLFFVEHFITSPVFCCLCPKLFETFCLDKIQNKYIEEKT